MIRGFPATSMATKPITAATDKGVAMVEEKLEHLQPEKVTVLMEKVNYTPFSHKGDKKPIVLKANSRPSIVQKWELLTGIASEGPLEFVPVMMA